MTRRIPKGMDPRDWAEQQIVEAMARGEFEHLHGKPLDLSDGNDPDWWLKRKLKDEEFVALPAALQLRREHDDLLEAYLAMPSRRAVTAAVESLNGRIRRANSHGLQGPPSTLMPLDLDVLLDRWAAADPERAERDAAATAPRTAPDPPPERPRGWRGWRGGWRRPGRNPRR